MNSAKTYLNYIDGQWLPSSSGNTFNVMNPANQDIIAEAQQSNEEDIEKAVYAAQKSFTHTNWRTNSVLRAEALGEFARLVSANQEKLARLLTINNGKTINEARLELNRCLDVVKYNAGLARNVFGGSIFPSDEALSVMAREAVGTVGIIVPWNWPLQLLVRDLIPALAAGNAVVIKPASATAAISMEFIELLANVKEIPPGIVNAVTGSGEVSGEALVASGKVNMISFTGDNKTGRKIASLAAKSMKKLKLELGGKSPNILFADADLKKAIPTAVKAVFTTSGQVCFAGTRLVVQDTIYDEVVGRMKAEAEKLKVGNGLDESCDMGPLISKSQLDIVMDYIELGKREGDLITGGYKLSGRDYDEGFFVAPTIFTNLPPDSRLVQEEIFGPVLVIQKFKTEAEAVEIANGTKYGLASAVWTNDLNRAIRVAREIKASTVWINTFFKLYHQAASSGCKESGVGKTRGFEGLFEFTEIKHINFDISPF